MNGSDKLTDNEVAFAALQLFGNEPQGAKPDWQEIHDWQLNLLSEPRASQVLSHVANDAEVFQQWQDICEAQAWSEAEVSADDASEVSASQQSASADAATASTGEKPAAWDLIGWFRKAASKFSGNPLPAFGGAVAATLLAVLVVPKLITGPSQNTADMLGSGFEQYRSLGAPLPQTPLTSKTTRSLSGVLGDLSSEEVQLHQLKLGYRNAFVQLHNSGTEQWQPWLESLPTEAVDCTLASNGKTCEAVSPAAEQLGQWGLLNFLACQQRSTLSEDYWQQQSESLKTLANNAASVEADSLLPESATLEESSTTGVCSIAEQLTSKVSE